MALKNSSERLRDVPEEAGLRNREGAGQSPALTVDGAGGCPIGLSAEPVDQAAVLCCRMKRLGNSVLPF